MIFAKENHMTQVVLETDCQVMVELWKKRSSQDWCAAD
jgi:hypothetical protein